MALFRGMRPDPSDNLPEVGNGRKSLDVLPGLPPDEGDIEVIDGYVEPGAGGLSVVADDPYKLPGHRKPKEMGGTSKGYTVFEIDEVALPDTLLPRQDDPDWPSHRAIEPTRKCLFDSFRDDILATRQLWTAYNANQS